MRVYIGVGALAAALIAVGQSGVSTPQQALALEKPTETPDYNSPAGFLPAPNPTPYCESMAYFNYFPSNVKALQDQVSYQVASDTTWTDPTNNSGVSMTFTTEQYSASSNGFGGFPTPVVSYSKPTSNGGLSTIGIIMNGSVDPAETAIANVKLSEPLFYSQWVFTDLDQSKEGFDLWPTWLSPETRYRHYGMFGPDNNDPDLPAPTTPGWTFETDPSRPTDITHAGFYSNRAKNVDGYQIQGRFQVDFYGPIDAIRMARYGSGGSGFATGAGCPPIGISKAATSPVWDPATQTFKVTYTMNIKNNLPNQAALNAVVQNAISKAFEYRVVGDSPEEIDAAELQVTDELDLTGFSSAKVSNLTGTNVTVNPKFDGVTDTTLLGGTDVLQAGGDGQIVFDVAYTPDFTDSDWDDCAFDTTNQSKVTALAAGVPVSDLSDNGTNASPGNVNEPDTGTDDPTPVSFSVACQVGLAKDLVEGSTVNNEDGTYTSSYAFKVGNYGDVNLTNFKLDDDLKAAYGDAFVSTKITKDDCNALNTTGGLKPGAFCDMALDVTFKPISGIEDPWINQASIVATVGPDPSGSITTTDKSQDGVEPDPDGDGDPTNNTKPTPNQITADIGLAKRVTAGPVNNGDGTYNVTYSLVATNFGFAYLDNIVVNDDLKATFGDALVDYKSDDKCATAILQTKGDSCEVIVNVTFRPGLQLRWENSADVTGNAGGTKVTDVSQDGVNPDPDGDGDPGNNSDPTPVEVTNKPAIEIVKALTTPAVQEIAADGLATVEYDLVVTNKGDVQLTDIIITDDLTATFGKDRFVSGGITVNGCTGVTLLAAQQTGGPGTCTAHVVALVRPGTDLGPDTNVANVSGVAPDGKVVEDPSNPVDVSFVQQAAVTTTTRPVPPTGGQFESSLGLAAILFLVGGSMLFVTRRRGLPTA